MVTVAPKIAGSPQDAGRPARVRVLPTSEDIRKYVKHPNGVKFGATMDASVEWPLDQFTRRRIRDGDVTVEESKGSKQQERRAYAPKTEA